jgi:hypothetical protein
MITNSHLQNGKIIPELKAIANKLRFSLNDSNINQQIEFHLSDYDCKSIGTTVFAIKMELSRLSKPTTRLIDLRTSKSNIEFETFNYGGRCHIMDSESIKVFDEMVSSYDGYTTGVYEHITENFKKTKQKIELQQFSDGFTIQPIALTTEFLRNEERMNLAVPVHLYQLNSNNVISQIKTNLKEEKNKSDGTTSNISHKGLRIKTSTQFKNNDWVAIEFIGLTSQFVFTQKYIAYQILKVVQSGDDFILFLRIGESKVHSEFNLFIKRLIMSHKGRYKVDVKGVCSSVRSKSHEHLMVSRSNNIDLFIDDKDIKYIFHSIAAKSIFDVLVKPSGTVEDLFYSLIHKDNLLDKRLSGKDIYFAIHTGKSKSSPEFRAYSSIIDGSDNAKYFLDVVGARANTMLFKVSYIDLSDKDFEISSSLPSTISYDNETSVSQTQKERLQLATSALKRIVRLTPVSSAQVAALACDSVKEICQNTISKFALKTTMRAPFVVVDANTNDIRVEDRYEIKTQVRVNIDGNISAGVTNDISGFGLSVKMIEDIFVVPGTKVSISFLEFIESSNKYALKNNEYICVSFRHNTLRLSNKMVSNHQGRRFWSEYIYKNIDNLTSKSGSQVLVGLAESLKQAISTTQTSTSAFFTVKSGKVCTLQIGVSRLTHLDPFWSPLRKGQVDKTYKPLFYSERFQSVMSPMFKNINKDTPYVRSTCIVTYEDIDVGIYVSHVQTFLTGTSGYSASVRYIDMLSKRNVKFKIFAIEMTKRSRPSDRAYHREMEYIEQYAPHKAKELVDDSRSLCGVITLKDITDLVKSKRQSKTVAYIAA